MKKVSAFGGLVIGDFEWMRSSFFKLLRMSVSSMFVNVSQNITKMPSDIRKFAWTPVQTITEITPKLKKEPTKAEETATHTYLEQKLKG